jgi:glycosyltransferase involved in cell wall biosynthesis
MATVGKTTEENEPLVSVIIPLYNGAGEIRETLEALCHQTHRNLEILVVDDGSTDDSAARVASVKDGRIRCLRQKNQGSAEARNNGLRECRGAYILFLDHDDLLEPEALEKAVVFLRAHPECGAAYYDFLYYTDGEPRRYFRHRFARRWSGNVFDNLLQQGPMCNPSQALLRRRAVEGIRFESPLFGSDDWDFFLQVASRGTRFGFIPEVLVCRKLSSGSLTGGVAGRVKTKNSSIRLYEKWMRILPKEKADALGLEMVLERIFLKRIFVMMMDEQYSAGEMRREARRVLCAAKDRKTRVQLRCFLAVSAIIPRAVLRALARAADAERTKHNFVPVPRPY